MKRVRSQGWAPRNTKEVHNVPAGSPPGKPPSLAAIAMPQPRPDTASELNRTHRVHGFDYFSSKELSPWAFVNLWRNGIDTPCPLRLLPGFFPWQDWCR